MFAAAEEGAVYAASSANPSNRDRSRSSGEADSNHRMYATIASISAAYGASPSPVASNKFNTLDNPGLACVNFSGDAVARQLEYAASATLIRSSRVACDRSSGVAVAYQRESAAFAARIISSVGVSAADEGALEMFAAAEEGAVYMFADAEEGAVYMFADADEGAI